MMIETKLSTYLSPFLHVFLRSFAILDPFFMLFLMTPHA